MVQPSQINSKISAYNQMWGKFNFEKNLRVPPGSKVIVNERPQERCTWSDHGVAQFYLGPEMHRLRNYYCYIPTTRWERVSNAVELFSLHLVMPKTSSEDRLSQVTQYVLAIQKNHPKTPFLDKENKRSDAINKLKNILQPPQRYDTSKTAPLTRVSVTSNQDPMVVQSDVARRESSRVTEMENRRKKVIKSGTQVR